MESGKHPGVLTLTMSPCVDRTLWYDRWDGKCVEEEAQSGGKGINVARVMANLGGDCLAVAPLGDETGRECRRLAEAEGVSMLPVWVETPTRVIVTRALRGSNEQRQEYVPASPLSRAELERLKDALISAMEGRQVFCACGTAPDQAGADFVRDMLGEAKRRGMITVLDAHGGALLAGAQAEPDILKPNETEAAQLLGRAIAPEEMILAAEELAARGQTILLTLGERGAVCACDGNLYCAPAPKVKAVNPVGSGDTFLAAWLHARIEGRDAMEALQFACQLAAENAAMFPAARVGRR